MSTQTQGRYSYRLEGELQPISEPWNIRQEGQHWQLHSQREIQGHPVLIVDAAYHGLQCQGFSLIWQQHPDSPRLQRYYQLTEQGLSWGEDSRHAQSLQTPAGWLFPLVRAATGPLLQCLLKSPASVLLPNLRDPSDKENFLSPLCSERRVEETEQGLRFYGGEYGEAGSDYYLNDLGLVERYIWESPTGRWEVELDQLEHPAEFKL